MQVIMLSIRILAAMNPRVAPDRMSTFTFSGGGMATEPEVTLYPGSR
jgi:hypothetical protein